MQSLGLQRYNSINVGQLSDREIIDLLASVRPSICLSVCACSPSWSECSHRKLSVYQLWTFDICQIGLFIVKLFLWFSLSTLFNTLFLFCVYRTLPIGLLQGYKVTSHFRIPARGNPHWRRTQKAYKQGPVMKHLPRSAWAKWNLLEIYRRNIKLT